MVKERQNDREGIERERERERKERQNEREGIEREREKEERE